MLNAHDILTNLSSVPIITCKLIGIQKNWQLYKSPNQLLSTYQWSFWYQLQTVDSLASPLYLRGVHLILVHSAIMSPWSLLDKHSCHAVQTRSQRKPQEDQTLKTITPLTITYSLIFVVYSWFDWAEVLQLLNSGQPNSFQ